MSYQNPAPGTVSNAIQELGNDVIEAESLGVGGSKTNPKGDGKIITNPDGTIEQWDQASGEWKFVGVSKEPWFGVPYSNFFYDGLLLSSSDGEFVSLGPGSGSAVWPEDQPQLQARGSRFEVPTTITKRIQSGLSWSIGNNGNGINQNDSIVNGQTILYGYLIRRESDGLADFMFSQSFLYSTGDQVTLAGTAWRVAGRIGQILFNRLSDVVMPFQQIGREFLIVGDRQFPIFQSDINVDGATADFGPLPIGVCQIMMSVPPSTGSRTFNTIQFMGSHGATPFGRARAILNPTSGWTTGYARIVGGGGDASFRTDHGLTAQATIYFQGWTDYSIGQISTLNF